MARDDKPDEPDKPDKPDKSSPPSSPVTSPSTSETSTSTASSSPRASFKATTQHPQGDHPPNTVFLNVYDVLTPSDPNTIPRLNNVLFHCGMGIFHTGVQVWGREFAFGGHAEPDTGIFEVKPRECPSVRYRTTLCLGVTHLAERHVERLIDLLGITEYVGQQYSLITRNCNTFSSHLATLLGVDDKFPAWVNRLASVAFSMRCILPEPLLYPLCEGTPSASMIREPRKPPRVATL